MDGGGLYLPVPVNSRSQSKEDPIRPGIQIKWCFQSFLSQEISTSTRILQNNKSCSPCHQEILDRAGEIRRPSTEFEVICSQLIGLSFLQTWRYGRIVAI